VAVKQVGICGSDVHLFLGHRPMPDFTALGHEAIGIITEVGLEVPKETKEKKLTGFQVQNTINHCPMMGNQFGFRIIQENSTTILSSG